MILNTETVKNKIFSVVIIGSGPAGISLALQLEKFRVPSLIVEAGDETFTEKASNRLSGEVVGNFPSDLSQLRLSQFGGTSGHWGGTCRTLDSYDFDKWLIKKSDLEKYLNDACNILDIKNSFRESLIDSNLKIIEFQQSNVRFYEKYYNYISKSSFISLLLNTTLYNLKFDNKNISEFYLKSHKDQILFLKSKYLVLACGGIENSRILLWCKENNKNLFENLPIGNYWMEHPFKILANGFGNFEKIKTMFSNNFYNFKNFMNFGEFTVSLAPTKSFIIENKILNSGLFLTLHERTNNSYKNILKNLVCIDPNISNKILKLFNKDILCGITISSSWEQEAEYSNRIILSEKRDNLGIPLSKLNYKISKKTLKTATTMFENMGNYFVKNNIGRLVAYDYLYDIDKFLTDAGYHHIGGTIMGEDAKNSVVDKNLKVHGINNLYVCGSSVFPTGGHANPTLTIIQLSLRLGTYLSDAI